MPLDGGRSGQGPATPAKVPQNEENRVEQGERSGSGARVTSSQRPSWLPPGWEMEDRVRTSGATAGVVDKYYFDPVSRRRFRSRKEVLYFLENGTLRGRKKPQQNSDANATPDNGSDARPGAGRKGSPSSAKRKRKGSASNFDFYNVPEKVEWVCTGSSEGSWTPFIGGARVLESSEQDWEAAFTAVTSKNGVNVIV